MDDGPEKTSIAAPYYEENDNSSSSSGSDSSIYEAGSSPESKSEYEEDEVSELAGTSDIEKWQRFQPRLGKNYFPFNDAHGNLLIGLRSNEEILISGCMRLQIVKGGIKYNNVHYSASWKQLSIWHPTSSSIPPISSSYYAGWDDRIFIDRGFSGQLPVEEFECVLRVFNGASGLLDISKLNPTFKDLWVPQSYRLEGCKVSNTSFSILSPSTVPAASYSTLSISKSWTQIMSELMLFHKNDPKDMRIVVIGGKNSGKSTLLRLLLQRFLHGDSENSEPVFYLDTDPGQPEYSKPDCISLCKVTPELVLGNSLGQAPVETISERYIGSNSPQDFPARYLADVDHLINVFEEEVHMGTTLLNLPGWIKGFGIRILNHTIAKFKPTHIIFLESSKRQSFYNELIIPTFFSTLQRDNYEPTTRTVDGYLGPTDHLQLNVLHASQLRQFRILSYFHQTVCSQKHLDYNFKPLVEQAPLQFSLGPCAGISAFEFAHDSIEIHPDDIQGALEGTVVGLFNSHSELEVNIQKGFRILKEPVPTDFLALAMVHSINVHEMYINLYIPDTELAKVPKDDNAKLLIRRVKTQTPPCELYPPNGVLSKFKETGMPFVAFDGHKKYEHIWKVRRNVMRRGHLTK